MSTASQALLKRHPSLTRAQFNEHWLHAHAVAGLYWALANGCEYYAQIHNPRLSDAAAAAPPAGLRSIDEWDGAAELRFAPPPGFVEAERARSFVQQVLVPDERRFMVGETRTHALFVAPGTVVGERKVLIEEGRIALGEDGKPLVDVEKARRIWEEWEAGEESAGSA